MNESPAFTPEDVSVVVASFNSRRTIARCLDALASQDCEGFEVIVVDSSHDETASFVASGYPGVLLVTSPTRLYPGDARNVGVRNARGRILAFVDADCVAAASWVRRIVAAHNTFDAAIVGGSVGNANPHSYVGWGAYFMEFSRWMPGSPQRRLDDIPTCCLSVRRELIERLGPFVEGTYCSDTVFNWSACDAGHAPLFVPTIHVAHTNISSLPRMWSKLRMHGRTYATIRHRHWRFSSVRLALYAVAASSVLPFVLYLRVLLRVAAVRAYLSRFLLTSPALMAALWAWSLGEAVGYAAALRGRPLEPAIAAPVEVQAQGLSSERAKR